MSQQSWKTSRRRFLAGAAAACAAPLIISRQALGDDKNVPANDKITVGCIGIGNMMFSSHMPDLLRMPEVKVVAVCDVDTTRRERRQETGGRRVRQRRTARPTTITAKSSRATTSTPIVFATPDHWHAMVILDACKAGKDMYCEKPLTNNLVEAKAVMDAVKASKIIFQTGSQQRSDDDFRYACELVRNGRLRQDRAGAGRRRRPSQPVQPARRRRWSLAWTGNAGWVRHRMRPYSSVLSPRGMHNHFPSWRNFSRVRRRRHDRLGRASLSTSPSGDSAWTSPARSRSYRPRIPRAVTA